MTSDTTGAATTLAELVDAFEDRARAPAIIAFGDRDMDVVSYEQLAGRARGAAADLRARGVGPGDRVALCAPNSVEWVGAYFGIVYAGAVAVPLDYQSGAGYLESVLAHARPRLLVTSQSRADELDLESAGSPDCMLLGAPESDPRRWQVDDAAAGLEPPTVGPGDLASLLYTSGTTGTPKAVPLTHGNIASNLGALLDAKLVSDQDRVLMPLPLHHTYPFTVGLLTPLSAGACVILPAGVSGPEISRASQESGATVLLAVPRLCAVLFNSIESTARGRGRFAARAFSALLGLSDMLHRYTKLRIGKLAFRPLHRRLGKQLRLIGCGGAKLDPVLEQHLEALGWRVLTGYGLTETSPVLTFNRPSATKRGTEGQPLPGVEIRVAPQEGLAHGEILARGPNVFSGYWQDEARSRDVFTDDGWFRTGDLGWVDDEGYLHVAGRSKEVIVLSDGKNVYPEEIEKVYTESPLFREVAVLEHEHGLAALIVPDDEAVREHGAMRTTELLKEALEQRAERLAPFQRASSFRITREPLPRTQLGKLKRHLLGDLYERAAGTSASREHVELTDDDRSLLATSPTREVWSWLEERFPDHELTLDTSPQLDLRVDSLEWVSVTLELERRFEVSLTAEAVSRIMTLRDLLNEVRTAEPAPAGEAAAGAPASLPKPPIPVVGAIMLGLARVLMRVCYRVRVTGAERVAGERALVFTPNHASYLDPLALAAALPWSRLRRTYWAGWVGKMHSGPLSRFVSRATRVFPVDPDRDLAGAIKTARVLLEQGYDVVWFPEGRRTPDGELGPFQRGIGLLLEEGAASAVPTAIHGTYALWPRHERRPRLGPVRVAFGEPRSADDLRSACADSSGSDGIRDALRGEVERLLAAE